MRASCHVALCLVLIGLSAPVAPARDFFLVIGGGPRASNNQVSLEKNVRYVQRLLAERHVPLDRQVYLFADGDDPGRDLHEKMLPEETPELNRWLAVLSGNTRNLEFRYRSHELDVDGAATKANVLARLRTMREELGPGDRLFLYVTAHGGRGKPTANARLYLWGGETLSVRELAAELDRFHPETKVVLVMVQCYSGGFANLAFHGGDPNGAPATHRRCGFYATVETRGAAGCTPEIEEANYREYSSYFWAALTGKTRTGQPIESADYDGDGQVCLAEAHAYVLTHADTIDIPVKTSEALLRRYSRVGNGEAELKDLELPLEELLALADPIDRYVLRRLAEEFHLDPATPVQAARELAADLEKDRKEKLQQAGRIESRLRMARRRVWLRLVRRWPELSNPWRADVPALLSEQGPEILRFLRSLPQFSTVRTDQAKAEQLRTEARELECQWAKVQRFIRVAEDVVLAANLPKLAQPEAVAAYQRLCALEKQPFLPALTPAGR